MENSEVSWDFEYDSESPELVRLYEKAKRYQWEASTGIDWSYPVDPSRPILGTNAFPIFGLPLFQRLSKVQQETLNASFTAFTLSQIIHGEQGALMSASKLATSIPQYEAKLCAASQVYDEARHVEVFRRYIGRIGSPSPPSPPLLDLLNMTLNADHWAKTMIGMQVVVEGLALSSLHNFLESTTDKTLQELLRLVLRDESRHVVFGQHCLAKVIREDPDLRDSLEGFTAQALGALRVFENNSLHAAEPLLAAIGVSIGDVVTDIKAELAKGGSRKQRSERQFSPLRHVIAPLLGRVGLLSDSLSARLRDARFDLTSETTLLDEMAEMWTRLTGGVR
jgi:hypothetical protein